MQARSWLLIFLLGIAGCNNSDGVSQTSETLNSETFQHPVFLGLSKICLPYIEKVTEDTDLPYKDAIAEIENLTHNADFNKGRLYNFSHRISNLVYFLGNKEYGAEVEVTHTKYASSHPFGRNEGQQCKSEFLSFDDYPSLEEFTRWLKLQDSRWFLNTDKSHEVKSGEVTGKYVSADFCKNKSGDFQESLSYFVSEIRELNSNRKPRVSITVKTSDTKRYPKAPDKPTCGNSKIID